MYTLHEAIMIRAQIYLTKTERAQLLAMSRQTGRSQSELIREAIDLFINLNSKQSENKLASMQAIKGAWKDRKDLPNFAKIRQEFDRD